MTQTGSRRDVYVVAIGQYLPGEPIPVDSIDDVLGRITKAPEKVVSRINRIRPAMKKMLGIDYVHFVLDPVTRRPTETNISLAVKAAERALASAGMPASDIDLVMYAGAWFDYMSPPSSTFVQERLGIELCTEMTIHANCTSVYKAIQIAADQISIGRHNTALIVTSQISSTILQVEALNEQRVTVDQAILRWFLSDGAGALILSADNRGPSKLRVVETYLESAGVGLEPGMIAGAGVGCNILEMYEEGRHHLTQDLNMVGKMAPKLTREACLRMREVTGQDTTKVRCVLLNLPMKHLFKVAEETMRELIANPDVILYSNISRVGYSGPAASIVALDQYLAENSLNPGDIVISFAVESSKWMHGGAVLEACR